MYRRAMISKGAKPSLHGPTVNRPEAGVATAVVLEYLDMLEDEVASYQVPVVDLLAVQSSDPFRILIATMLSARTKDEVTAVAADRLFIQAPDAARLALLSEDEIAQLIYPVGFYRTKARHLLQTARILQDRYDGVVPRCLEALVKLPGVGRKTANLVLSLAFAVPAICVDTHVHRIMNIWGFVATSTPYDTELALQAKLPQDYWRKVNRLLVAFGQQTCRPVAPHCDRCLLGASCARIGVRPRLSRTVKGE